MMSNDLSDITLHPPLGIDIIVLSYQDTNFLVVSDFLGFRFVKELFMSILLLTSANLNQLA